MPSDDEDARRGAEGALQEQLDDSRTQIQLLRDCLSEQTRVAQANANALTQLTEAMKNLAPVPVVAPTPEEVRNGKFEKLYMLWLKQNKFKEFKHSDSVDVC